MALFVYSSILLTKSSECVFSTFTIFDSLILIAYLIIVLSIGFYYSRRQDNSSTDYFLAGRDMGWIAVGLSIFATNISSEHFIGLAGSGSTRGLAVGQFELMAIFILIILGWFIAPIYIKSGVTTMPEFLEKRFDRKSRKFFAILSILMYIFTKITVTIFAGGILFNKIFGINIYTSALILILITGLYSVIGGSTAVMKTHIFQGILLILAAIILTIFSLHEVGGISGLKEKLSPEYFEMFKSGSDPDYPWTGIIFGAPIIAFWYWCTDQYIVQRLLSAKSINDARRGSLLAALLKILPLFILVLPGVIAVALFPEIRGDEAYPALLASNILPVGVKGFVVAGILAAIMSSLSSVFNSTATIFTNDFYKPRNPESSERKLVLVGRLSTTAIVITAIICVPLVKIIGSQVYLFLQGVQAYIGPPITAVFIFGLFFKKTTAKAAIWTFIIGESIGVLRLISDMMINFNYFTNPLPNWFSNMNFLHFAIFSFVVSSILIYTFSLATQNMEAEKQGMQFLFPGSLKDVNYEVNQISTVSSYRVNILISVFILIIIFGLWSLW